MINDPNMATRLSALLAGGIVADITAPLYPLSPLTPDDASTDDWLNSYEKSGCNWISLTVGMDVAFSIEQTIERVAQTRRWLLARTDRFLLAESSKDIQKAKETGRIAVQLHFQGTMPFSKNIALVEIYKKLGVSHALMAYNNKNVVGDGCSETNDGGLSIFGRELVAEMNRVGMMVDVTHTGFRTAMETIEVSTSAVILSHSNPENVFKHTRNVSDELIVAVANSGGVMGINGVGIFMSAGGRDISASKIAEFVDYGVQLVGPAHIGLGLDYMVNAAALLPMVTSSEGTYPKKDGYHIQDALFASPMVIPELAELLLKRNYSDSDVQGILGENWFRVFKEVCG